MHVHMKLMDTPTSIDCGREVRCRRSSFRSLMECVVPSCCGPQPSSDSPDANSTTTSSHASSSSSTILRGTFFGYRNGRVSFCIQEDSRSISSSSCPLLLLEFGVPTAFLAREMQHGLLRIALVECCNDQYNHKRSDRDHEQRGYYHHSANSDSPQNNSNILKVPVWCMYCNGRKVGFAMRRELTAGDLGMLKLMSSVSVGAGVLPETSTGTGGDLLMYLRANFQRVIGSADSQSFHMINPDNLGNSGQELSVFLLRSTN